MKKEEKKNENRRFKNEESRFVKKTSVLERRSSRRATGCHGERRAATAREKRSRRVIIDIISSILVSTSSFNFLVSLLVSFYERPVHLTVPTGVAKCNLWSEVAARIAFFRAASSRIAFFEVAIAPGIAEDEH